MKTNTEKAIEFLNDCQDDYEELQEEGNNKGILEVIKLLQRGEKFEEIVNELFPEQYHVVEILVQKYFPKPKDKCDNCAYVKLVNKFIIETEDK